MLAADDVSVWLEWQGEAAQTMVVPHVRSRTAGELNYRVFLYRTGAGGASSISQGGAIRVEPAADARLGTMRINRASGESCAVEVKLFEGVRPLREDRFDCP